MARTCVMFSFIFLNTVREVRGDASGEVFDVMQVRKKLARLARPPGPARFLSAVGSLDRRHTTCTSS